MTPSQAATVFRELLQTRDDELGLFARRAGLHSQPSPDDLMRARELLQAVSAALESGRGPDWARVQAAWSGLRGQQAPAAAAVSDGAAAQLAADMAATPDKPGWVRQATPQKPSLDDLAAGAAGQPRRAEKFIPVARPRFVPTPGSGAPVPAAPEPAAQPPVPAAAIPPAVAAPPAAAVPLPAAGVQPSYAGQPALPAMPELLAPMGQAHAKPVGFVGSSPAAVPPAQQPPPTPAAVPASASAPPAAAAPAAAPAPPPRRDAGSAPAPPPAPTGAAVDDAGSVYQSVAKYAAFCAACAEFPTRLGETLAGYGLRDEAERAALDEDWQDRFDDDPDAMAKWEQLFAHFRQSLRSRR